MKLFLKFITLLIFLPILASPALAQDSIPAIQNKTAMEKIQSARIALISSRLNLTPAQAQKFWPIYNEYLSKRRAIQQQLLTERQGVDLNNLSEEQSKKLMDQSLDLKQQMVDLEKDYSQRLQQVITAQQILELRQAEQDFRRMIIERLQQRRMQQMRREQMLQRRDN